MKNKVAVIGAGSFGTSLAMLLVGKGHEVSIWGRKKSQMALMRETLENPHYLPGVRLPKELNIVDNMEDIFNLILTFIGKGGLKPGEYYYIDYNLNRESNRKYGKQYYSMKEETKKELEK